MLETLAGLIEAAPSFVDIALLGTGVLLVAIAATLVYLIWLRMQSIRHFEIVEEVEDTWKPVLRAIRAQLPVAIPTLERKQEPVFLELWLENRELATGQYAINLDALARDLELDRTIRQLLRYQPLSLLSPPARSVGIAIRAARWIDTTATREVLHDIAKGDNQGFSIHACETLLLLGDRDSTHLAVSLLFRYPEHDRYITRRLGHAGGERVLRVLDPFLEKLPNAQLMDFIYLIEQSGDQKLLPILIRMLASSPSDEETASLLRALGKIGGRDQRDLVLPFLSHHQAFVRLQAANTLSTVGRPEDAELLLPLLSDPDWWIRYRAAQSYLALTAASDEEIQSVIDKQADRYAHDILVHARSEATWYQT